MNSGDHRIFGMQYQAQAAGKKVDLTYLKISLHTFGQGAVYGRNIYTSFFKDSSIFDYPGTTTTTFWPLPVVLPKFGLTINTLELVGYTIL